MSHSAAADAPGSPARAPAAPMPIGILGAWLAVWLAIAVFGVLHHEMWRDELEIWLIARDSPSLGALFANLGTQGHPSLWYVLVWLVARISDAPAAIEVLNLACAFAAAAVVLVRAPFPPTLRVLLAFGYFPLYEYGVLARSYALETALLFGFCAAWDRRRRIGVREAVLLALLAHVHLYGAIFAGLAVVLAVVETRGERTGARRWAGPGVVATAVALSVAHVAVQKASISSAHLATHQRGWDLAWLLDGLRTLWRGFVPLPDLLRPIAAWNSNVLDAVPGGATVQGVLGIAVLVAAAAALRRRPAVLAVWAAGSAALLALVLLFWSGSLRHHGQQFVWWLACVWLARPGGPWLRRGLAAVLAVHVAAAACLLAVDAVFPFSRAREAAAWVSEHRGDAVVVGSTDFAVEPLAAYLDVPIWYPEKRGYGTFLVWSDVRHLVPPSMAIDDARSLALREGRDVLLVMNSPGPLTVGQSVPLAGGVRMRLVAEFVGALVPDESYWIYRLSAVDSPADRDDNGSPAAHSDR